MKRFQITAAEYEAIKAKEAEIKDKNVSRRLRVLMLRYEGKSLDEISKIHDTTKASSCLFLSGFCSLFFCSGLCDSPRPACCRRHRWR